MLELSLVRQPCSCSTWLLFPAVEFPLSATLSTSWAPHLVSGIRAGITPESVVLKNLLPKLMTENEHLS